MIKYTTATKICFGKYSKLTMLRGFFGISRQIFSPIFLQSLHILLNKLYIVCLQAVTFHDQVISLMDI